MLDNFEHVFAAAPAVAGLLEDAPDLHALVTSRMPLRLRAEVAHRVPQLALPDLRRPAVAGEVMDYESVRLFVHRARAAAVDFSVTDLNVEAVAEICVRLDGLPLAIELAAPRVRTLTPPALLRRLDQGLSLLTGGAQDVDARQRTLRGTIAWSHDLLLLKEKTLFERLAVFVGGCRLEAAEAVCDFDGTFGDGLLDALDSLVEKSLLRQRQDSDGEPRFWMLETIREFGLELLESADELERACERHAEWTASEAERLDAESRTATAGLSRADARRVPERARGDRVRAQGARRRAAVAPGDSALGVLVVPHLRRRGQAHTRGGARAQRPAAGADAARALHAAHAQREWRTAERAAEEALTACEELGDDYSLAQAWNLVGRVAGNREGLSGNRRGSLEQALSLARRGNFRAELAESISWLMVSAVHGPLPVEEGIERCREFSPSTATTRRSARRAPSSAPCSRRCAATSTRRGSSWPRDDGRSRNPVSPCGPRSTRRRPISSSTSRARRARRPRRARQLLDARRRRRARLPLERSPVPRARPPRRGEVDEAERFSRECEQAAAPDDVLSQMLWRTARAKILARRGDLEPAEALAREAVGRGEPTDLLGTRADALVDLAEVLALAGRREDSLAALGEASELYERKGNLTALARAAGASARRRLTPARSDDIRPHDEANLSRSRQETSREKATSTRISSRTT